MSAKVFRMWDYRTPEAASACDTRLFINGLRKLADEGGPVEDTAPSEMIPYHGAGIDGMDEPA